MWINPLRNICVHWSKVCAVKVISSSDRASVPGFIFNSGGEQISHPSKWHSWNHQLWHPTLGKSWPGQSWRGYQSIITSSPLISGLHMNVTFYFDAQPLLQSLSLKNIQDNLFCCFTHLQSWYQLHVSALLTEVFVWMKWKWKSVC